MEFTKEHKAEISQRLPFGVHKVEIIGFNHEGIKEGEKEYIEVGFVNEDGIEDKARAYFLSDKNSQISFNTFRAILIHNTSEENREKARKIIDEVANTTKLTEMLNTRLIGKEMWVTKYLDPNRTYEKEGVTYQSVNVNFYGYEPKLNESLMPKKKESTLDAAQATFGTPAPDDAPPFKGSGTQESDWA